MEFAQKLKDNYQNLVDVYNDIYTINNKLRNDPSAFFTPPIDCDLKITEVKQTKDQYDKIFENLESMMDGETKPTNKFETQLKSDPNAWLGACFYIVRQTNLCDDIIKELEEHKKIIERRDQNDVLKKQLNDSRQTLIFIRDRIKSAQNNKILSSEINWCLNASQIKDIKNDHERLIKTTKGTFMNEYAIMFEQNMVIVNEVMDLIKAHEDIENKSVENVSPTYHVSHCVLQ